MDPSRRVSADLLEQIPTIDDVSTLNALLGQETRAHGFNAHAAGQLVPADPAAPFFLLDWPPRWMQLYAARGFAQEDVAVLAALHETRSFTWPELKAYKPAMSTRVFEAALEHFGWRGGEGRWWPGQVDAAPGSTFPDFFAKDSENLPLTGLIVGLLTDSADTRHLVMMMDPAAAASYDGVSFADSFPADDETALIDALYYFTTENRDDLGDAGQAAWDASSDLVDAFVSSMPFFTMGSVGSPAPFTVVSWSTGHVAGTGWSIVAPAATPAPGVPEPAALLLLGCGLGGAALRRRRRRGRSSTSPADV